MGAHGLLLRRGRQGAVPDGGLQQRAAVPEHRPCGAGDQGPGRHLRGLLPLRHQVGQGVQPAHGSHVQLRRRAPVPGGRVPRRVPIREVQRPLMHHRRQPAPDRLLPMMS
ncbi:hypothetical protein VPH35_081012 [Triticum aestivum]